ncbi:MAG: hypothetical protein O7C67_01560, partial [Gammaproteobacteria bacterium]|nr:hypothetical protein [Gammaproteobacteria bacterium]
NLDRIDRALEGLARKDASERLVQDTLKNVRDAQTADHVPNRFRDRRWAGGIAAAVVAVSALGIVFQQFDSYRDVVFFRVSELFAPENVEVLHNISIEDAAGEDLSEADKERLRAGLSSERGAGIAVDRGDLQRAEDERPEGDSTIRDARRAEKGEAEEGRELNRNGSTSGVGGRVRSMVAPAVPMTPALGPYYRRYAQKQKTAKVVGGDQYREHGQQTSPELRAKGLHEGKDGSSAVGTSRSEIIGAKPNSRDDEFVDNFKKQSSIIEEIVVTGSYTVRDNFDTANQIVDPDDDTAVPTTVGDAFSYQGEPVNGAKPTAELEALNKLLDYDGRLGAGNLNARLVPDGRFAERFLARYRNLDGLNYQQSTGYWANSYLPGDPAMRRLEAQLRTQYPEALTTTLVRNTQPFDAPDNAALSIYLQATQSAVDGPTRVQLQVGLKAAERQGGHRPPMNVAVVLDLPEMVELSVAQQARALLMALNEQRQSGDRFSVTVAGVPGGSVIGIDDYRHGTVVSFIERLADGQLEGDTLYLVDALVNAVDRLATNDDPNAVLGSSLVLLVTADGIEPQTRESLELLAHRSAIAGMPVSLVTLAGVNSSDLDAVALAGQGRLRSLSTPADAAQLIDRELHSASRTVARAVRLRIQLAPGVRLVDVIGSVRLDELYAERVREAEQSIDARLSRNWGIEADRGEDEEGIQIVIPGMAAGESHVVLLDVVVDGPGTVADVRVRYKDLVQMSNGVARASLSLADADATRRVQGPLERNVLKNLVAFEVAEAARSGGRLLANGETAAARAELMNALTLIAGLRQSVAGWENDAELQADEQRLARFVSELDAGRTDLLVAALAYAAYRKLLPATMNED